MAEYTLIYSVPAEVTVIVVFSVPAISEKVKGVTVEQVLLRRCVLL